MASLKWDNLHNQINITDSDEEKRFFTEMLADIDGPTIPFDLCNNRGNETEFGEAHLELSEALTDQLRTQAKQLQTRLASVCHLAWAQVLARTSGREAVVFGTVLSGRCQSEDGNDSAIEPLMNILPLGVNMNDTSVENAVHHVDGQLSESFAHRFASLAMTQRCSGLPPDIPLFSALLNYRHNQHDHEIGTSLSEMTVLHSEELKKYPLTLTIDDDNDSKALRLTVTVDPRISADRICAYMEQALISLSDSLQHTPEKPVRTMAVLPREECHLLLHTFNHTATTYPTERCAHQFFEDQVTKNGDKIAVQCEGETLSYAELNAQANWLAHYLIQLGVKPDSRVGLCMSRNTALVVGILGILKSGGAYVPLDPAYPTQRLINIVQDADPICILTDSASRNALGTHVVQMVHMEEALLNSRSVHNPDITMLGLTSNHLAYVIYTSGSTGTPKGVMVEHRNVTNYVNWIKDAFDTNDFEHTLFSTSVSFDISIFENLVPLSVGKAIYIVPNAISLAGIPSTISMINTVPSAMTAILNANNLPSSVRAVYLGGEPLTKRLIENVFARSQISKLFNFYGPTETTVYSTWHEYVQDDVIVETIGKPVANTRIYLLDLYGEPVPLGAEGELYIGGAGVARGYWNRPDLTAERFLPDLFCGTPRARVYRTGDRARYLSDGNLIFLGRSDQQVKVRGYRIEPGEIEACLVNHSKVREAVVHPRSDQSDTRLIAYVVADPDALLARDLRTYLSSLLPSYMVPAAFVTLSTLPLTPNGKLDRRALPVPDDTAFATQPYEAPQGELEEKLAAIWRELLGIEHISRHDNFFELGGHSLLVVRLLAQLRQDGLDANVRAIFDSSSLATLAATLLPHEAIIAPPNLITTDSTKITPEMLPLITISQAEIDIIIEQVPGGISNIQDIYGLAPLQHGILYHHMTSERGDPYLTTRRMLFADRSTIELYVNALEHVVERHDILRTAFIWEGLNETAQVIWRKASAFFIEHTLEQSDEGVLEQLSRRYNADHYKLDLSQAPLLRLIAAPTTDGGWIVIQLMHHIIGDNFTVERINSEVRVIVNESCRYMHTPTPFRHVVAQTRLCANPEKDNNFFSEMLADVDGPTLPFGLYDVRGNKNEVNTADLWLPKLLNDQLRALAKHLKISLASLCHLAWAQVLAHSSGRESVVFGTVLFGRFQAAEGNDTAMGLLINTLPLRINIDGSTATVAVRQTHARLSELLSHEHASLALAQRCSGVPASTPLFSALLNYRHNKHDDEIATPLSGLTILSGEDRTNYPLTLSIDDNDNDTLRLRVDVMSSVSATRICAYMQQALTSLANALQHTPQQPLRTLAVLPPEERHLLLHTFNQTAATYPTEHCVHQLIEAQVANNGNKIAVQCEEETLSYTELNAQANQLAHYLIQLGVKPDSRVGLCMTRNAALLVGILGILKSGGAYVPLDPAYPTQRLINILHDADPICIVTDTAGRNTLGTHEIRMVDMEQTLPANLSDHNPDNRMLGLTSNHLAYVIYTSGSTGTPKGVMVEHRNVTNYVNWIKDAFDTKDLEQTLFSTSVSFDISIFESIAPLSLGKAIYVVPDVISLAGIPSTISMINTVPSAMIAILNANNLPSSVRAVYLGGEPLTKRLIENIFAKSQISKVCNLYGPTETTIDSTWHKYARDDMIVETIGKPLANALIYLLDSHGEPVPLGAEGELYIGGAGVARGYLNRPDLTADRFLPDRFCGTPGARMYRSGDRARYLSDGSLIYLGRSDQQVKVHGYRIEPGEIEAQLVNHPRVREAVVQPRNDGTDTRLIAFVVADPDALLARDLRTYLSSLLPSYMVPAAFVTLSALPLTPNGKMDRRALPVPDDKAFATQSYEAPQGELEEKLAAIWRELLCIERISRHDNFFELGGHSLLIVRVLAHLRQDGLDTNVRATFNSSSLATLAATLSPHQPIITPPNLITPDSTKITPEMLPLIKLSQAEIDIIIGQIPGGIANIQDIYGLAPLQQGILYHHMKSEKSDPYVLVTNLHFTDRAALETYSNALQHVIERHDIFRTAFIWKGLNEPAQVVWRQVPSILTEISLEEDGSPVLDQLDCHLNSHNYRFDLTQAPLLRLIGAPMSDGGWLALQLFHHSICDHLTVERLNTEVHAVIDGRSKHLLSSTPFRNYVTRSRLGVNPDDDKRFFSEMLDDVDAPTLPFGLNDVSGANTAFNEAHLRLPQVLTDQLRAQAEILQMSLATLCHLAWAHVLAHSTGRESVVFGTLLLGRFQSAVGNDNTMGLLMNTLPLRLNIDNSTVKNAARYVHAQLTELLNHEYASLATAQRCSGLPPDIPLFSALLNYRHNQHDDVVNNPLPGITVLNCKERTNYPLTLSIDDNIYSKTLQLSVIVDSAISATRICAYMQQALTSMANALQHTPHQPVRTMAVLPPEERHLLLHTFNQTAVTYPIERCVHQLFEDQVTNNANKVAVQCEGETMSYAELNAQANRLAHYLIQLGAKPDSRVGLCMARNTALVVGILGILKSGGAYVPLDPAYPTQRLINILQDADTICILTDSAGRNALGTREVRIVDIEQALTTNLSDDNPDIKVLGLNSSHLAYVIYTSGSTGKPKGVMVEHRNVTNFIYLTKYVYDIKDFEHTLFSTSISFDMSVLEHLAPLSLGKAIYIVPDVITLEGIPSTISMIHLVPCAMTALLNLNNVPSSLRAVSLGGEPFSKKLIENTFAQSQMPKLYHIYGPTEATVFSTWHKYVRDDMIVELTIGKPIANARIYLLDSHCEVVPLAAEGEIYIGGAGVTRGYLNRPDLTAERFLPDPFCDTIGARMYRTGDRARYLSDGNLIYLGRYDQQVKVRGYRIEPGEIEACLVNHPRVREAVVQPRGHGSDSRLIAYVVGDPDALLAQDLRTYLSSLLPSYMVPAAFVTLAALPLTPNGKLDRRALPVPDDTAFASQSYEAPQGELEEKLAAIWRELLGIARISRHDNFFELGGHSLLVVRLIAQLRQDGLDTNVRATFESSSLATLAATVFRHQAIIAPPNLITTDSSKITPAMLPLIKLSQAEIDIIIGQVPGRIANIQDIYGLAPLQQGILYHHMTAERGDPYLTTRRMRFADRSTLELYVNSLQHVIERHDNLRTAFIWEGLNEPAQVVWRKASAFFIEHTLEHSDEGVLEQLSRRYNADHYKLDLSQAPLLRLMCAPTTDGGWIVIQLTHHIIGDNFTGERINSELRVIINDSCKQLDPPTPFRHVVAQIRLCANPEKDKHFFSKMLADIDGPTLPFGLYDIRGNKNEVNTADLWLPKLLNDQLRTLAKRLKISLASLCHLAWAQVLAHSSGRESVVFGTVLFGRFQAAEGNDTAMGLLINTLPLRINIDETTVTVAVRQTHARLSELLSHEHASLALAQRCSGLPANTPLFSALFNYRHNQHGDEITTPLPGLTILSGEDRTNYPLTLSIDDNDDDTLRLTVDVTSSVSSTRICAYMQQALTSLADALQHKPEQPVRALAVLPPEERHLLLHTFNQTAATYPTERCVHQLFEDQATNNGNKIAVQCEGEALSYAELNAQANRLSHDLIQLGVKPDSRVGLCMARNTALLIGILGILKSGGAYVPLDPAYPTQRLINILHDADPVCILVDSMGRNALGTHEVQMVDMEQTLCTNLSDHNPDITMLGLMSNHLAYVIYTSGSTGTPKGVMVEHRNVTNYVYWIIDAFETKDFEHTLSSTSVSFDASIFENLVPLSLGKAIYIVPDVMSVACVPPNISMINTVPSAMTALLNGNNLPSSLRVVSLGGEPLSKRLIETIFAKSQISELCNLYGPTEATIDTTWHKFVRGDVIVETIGKPIANVLLYLLDSHGEPVPLGAEGELYIGGASVARGYLNRPDLTAERFLPDPFCDTPGGRMYRTGDRARYLSDGNLIYLGRSDQQIKIRGYRIEPGEIEAQLVNHPSVREAVVHPRSDGYDTHLIAYVVADPDTLLARHLRTHLSSLLPSYMVPAAFVTLSALPLTHNGKLDRRALPVPDDTTFATQLYEEPHGELEEKLAAIWRKLLGIERVSRHDNFFELGGHSLLVVRLLAHLRQDGLDTNVRAMFDSSSLATLAATLFRHQAIITPPNLITTDTTKITPEMLPLIKLSQAEIDIIIEQVPGGIANIQDIYGLAPLQQGILFHHMTAERGDPYLTTRRMKFADRSTIELYLNALQHLIERHDNLRTAFIWEGLNEPAQVVWRKASDFFIEHTLEHSDEGVLEQLSRRYNADHYKLDLSQAPLLRLMCAPTTDGGWIVIQLTHHIIGDNFTGERINSELRVIINDSSKQLDPPTPFRHVVAQTRLCANPEKDKKYFSEMLADVYGPTLPFGLYDVRGNKNDFNTADLRLPKLLNDQLRALAKRLKINLASLCHLAWAQVLAHSSGRESVVFGTVLFGRFQAAEGSDTAMGLLINTLPLRLNIDGSTATVAVRQTHARLSELLSHEHASLALAQRCSGVPANTPLFSALFNYRHNKHDVGIDTPLPGLTMLSGEDRTNYPLTLSIDDNDNDMLRLTVDVTSSVSATRICAYMQQALTSLADALQNTPVQPMRTMAVLPPEERHLLLHTFNQTATTYPTERCVHQLFEDQVTNNANMIAVQCEGETLSYAKLNAQANRLAHYLIQRGVKPDSRVGLCMARNTALVVGILGIMKSGGAFVPLDPVYPTQRLTNILQDADPICILTDPAGRNVLGTHEVPIVDMEQALSNSLSDQNPDITMLGLTSSHLAYVIYTSGSTGTPKGVMVEHRNVTNFIYWTIEAFDAKDLEHTLFSTSVSWDPSIYENISPLSIGKAIYIVRDAISLSNVPSTISMFNTVPSVMTALLNLDNLPSSLRAVNLTGEPLTKRLIENIFAKSQISKLCNQYGPTETTIISTWHKYGRDDVIIETIGKPIANARIYLLDSYGEPVLLRAEGELYIGGAGVTRGYLNRPDLTAERFLPDPFCDTPDARMYRTGDRARYLSDGNLIYLGRSDQQVKVRGHRIEPGEIEAQLVNHPKVREAVVQSWNDGSDTRLIAYVVADPDASLAVYLRTYLSSLLPSYMVPAAFVTILALPLTPNGKLDRQALPVPDYMAFATQSYEAPQGEFEEKLAEIWRELLGIERISRHDNFFELGGHSLLVMQLLSHKDLGDLHIDPDCVFTFPILMDFARAMAQNFIKLYRDAAIPIRRTGTRMSIFVLPEGLGGIAYGFELAHDIDKQYPIYALPWPLLENKQLSSMEELAETMIPLIENIQTNGPCALIGYSAGGLLAYEIARQLINRNYPVAFLGLLDTYPPIEESRLTKTDILLWSLALKYPIFKTLNTSWCDRVRKLSLDEAVEEIKTMNAKDIKEADLERLAKLTIEQYHYQNICAEYKIQPVPLKIHLFMADTWNVPYTGSEFWDNQIKIYWENNVKYFNDRLGWGELDDLQVIPTKGDHYSIISDPKDRALLAKKIENSINSC